MHRHVPRSSGLLALLIVLLLAPPALIPAPLAHAQAATPLAGPVTTSAPTCGDTPATGRLLYAPWPEVTSEGEIVVVNGEGMVERRLAIAGITAGQPTAWPDTVLLWTAAETMVAANAATGDVIPVPLPAPDLARLIPVPVPGWAPAGPSRYWVFGGPRQDLAYLDDVTTGATTDLAALITARGDPFTELQAAFIAPGDAAVMLWTDAGLYLLDPAAPGRLTALDPGNGLAAPGFFTPDGRLIYSRVTGTTNEVVITPLAGGAETVHDLGPAPVPRRAVLFALPGQDAALIAWVAGRETNAKLTAVERLDLATGATPFIISLPEAMGYPIIAPDGGRFVIGGDGPGGITWQLVEAATGDRASLPALQGLMLPGNGYVTPAALFFPLEALMDREGSPGRRYVALDLTTGATHELVQQRAGYDYSFPLTGAGGRIGLIAVSSPDRSALLALDLASGDVRSLDVPPGTAGGLLAPDGCWVLPVSNRGLLTDSTLLSLGTGQPVVLPAGAGVPVWAFPVPAPVPLPIP